LALQRIKTEKSFGNQFDQLTKCIERSKDFVRKLSVLQKRREKLCNEIDEHVTQTGAKRAARHFEMEMIEKERDLLVTTVEKVLIM